MRLHLLFFFSLFTCSIHAQRLSDVSAVYTGTSVVVRFTILPGNQCSGYSILHTADSTQPFSIVYDYPYMCGEQTESEQHFYPHTSAVPEQVNYYKVRLTGPFEESQIVRVFASSVPQSMMNLFPNPAGPHDELVSLKLQGAKDNVELFGFLLQPFGNIHREVYLTPVNGGAQVPISDLPQGGYVLWLTDGNSVFASKFIILD